MKRFNVTGNCIPDENYMVDISGKITQIRNLIDNSSYFTINRARQYGKTTTLAMLEKAIEDDYTVVSISFQGLGDESFASPERFCMTFTKKIQWALQFTDVEEEYAEKWVDSSIKDFMLLDRHIAKMCKGKKIVLMIDEVDQASNNRVFLHFLGMLREKYLSRRNGKDYTFHSVILAGVYDIKTMKLKMMSEGTHTPSAVENRLYNSPWNIAVHFNVDMSFRSDEIATMLNDYESDHNTGMDITAVSQEIYDYTHGYPFLVSRICQCIDEELDKDWTGNGVRDAVKILLIEDNTLFSDIFKNLENNLDLYKLIYDILIVGKQRTYSRGNPAVDIAEMYGIVKKNRDKTVISNMIFEIIICNYFISKDENKQTNDLPVVIQSDIVRSGKFDMALCLRKFAEHYTDIYSSKNVGFVERECKFLFITYLKPLLNGYGFYHFESQLSDERRMDIVIDFGREQFIVELKIWHGEKKHSEAYSQLCEYLESMHISTGYLLTFDFRKEQNKEHRAEWIEYDGKKIYDVII